MSSQSNRGWRKRPAVPMMHTRIKTQRNIRSITMATYFHSSCTCEKWNSFNDMLTLQSLLWKKMHLNFYNLDFKWSFRTLTSCASFCSLMFSAMYLTLSRASLTSGDSGSSGITPPSIESELEHWLPALTAPPPVSAPMLPSPPLAPPESAGSLLDLPCQQQLQWPSQPKNAEPAPLPRVPLKLLRLERSVLLKSRWRFVRLDTALEAGAWGLCCLSKVPDEWMAQGLERGGRTLFVVATLSGSLSGLLMNMTLGSIPRNTVRTQQGMVWVFGVR